MKTKLSTVLLLCAVITPVALAQETTPTPGEQLSLRGAEPSLRSEPSVSVPTATPTPDYPRPGTSSATPKPKAAPKEAASPSPAPAAMRAAKPTKTKAAPSPVVKKETPLPASVGEMEKVWAEAIAKHDLATIETCIASDYVGVSSAGNVMHKSSLMADLKKDKNTYDSVTNSGVVVRSHGDAAVAVGTTTQKGKDAAGKSFAYSYRWTDMWVKREGAWQCVASQSIRWQK